MRDLPAPDPRDECISALEQTLADIQAQFADLKAGAVADVAEVSRAQAEAPKLDLKNGDLGAWEVAARYSNPDLNFREGAEGLATPINGVRGGEQEITTLGLNFYPNNVIRFLLDYQWASVDRLNPKNLADSGSPVGAQIGQDYQALALRTQLAF